MAPDTFFCPRNYALTTSKMDSLRHSREMSSCYQALALLVCVLCTSCGIMKNKYAADLVSPLEANETTGLMILSVGALETCSASTALLIQKFDKPYNANAEAFLLVDSYAHESDFSDHPGHLYVVKLAPGKYYLSPYLIGGSYSELLRADFELHANEITYLGEFFMPRSCGFSSNMGFRDQETRDMHMLKSKNPAFETVKITKRLLVFTGLAERALWPF